MKGIIFSLEEFSVYDGPGIRTSVFLKGCPLRCSWCHNPEGQSFKREIVRSPNGCLGCGSCERHAERDGERIIYTEASITACPRGLLRASGEEMTASALCEKLLKHKRLLRDGGVTFSGGEPTSQSVFLFECLDKLEGKLHRAVQTSGYCGGETFVTLLEKVDYVLYDLKIINDTLHKKYVGASNADIIANYKTLTRSGKDFVTRIPLIPTVTDTEANIRDICTLMNECNVKYAELLPYNKMAGGKYAMTGRIYEPDFDESAEVQAHPDIFAEYGINIQML